MELYSVVYCVAATMIVSKANVPVLLPMSVCVISAGRRMIARRTVDVTIIARVNMNHVSVMNVNIGQVGQHVNSVGLAAMAVLQTLVVHLSVSSVCLLVREHSALADPYCQST